MNENQSANAMKGIRMQEVESVTTRRRHSRGLATRARILSVAERLFAQGGIDGVSLRKITAEAQVDLALINYHFKSKWQLYQAIFARRARVINRARLRALRDKGPDATVEQIVDAFVEPLMKRLRTKNAGWQYYVAMVGQITYSKKFLDFQHEQLDETAQVFSMHSGAQIRTRTRRLPIGHTLLPWVASCS